MTNIEVTTPQLDAEEKIPVSTRGIYIKISEESLVKSEDPALSDDVRREHADNADRFERLANAPTTDEMRQERFGTDLPEGSISAPGYRSRVTKIGATALG